MAEPILTVAVPTCNGAAHLAEAIRSIVAQDGVALDLVVSDDRSDDETIDVVRAAAGDRVRIEINPERLGLAGNWNRCVALSRTPIVAVFHQDDVMEPGHLAAHTRAFEADERIGLVAGASEVIDDRGETVPETVVGRGGLGPVDRILAPGELAPEMTAGNLLRCSAVTLRRDRVRRPRRIRRVVSIRARLGVLAACLAAMEGRMAGPSDRPRALACGQRDASIQDQHRRPGRDGASSRRTLCHRLEGPARCRSAPPSGRRTARASVLESGP